LVKQNNFVLSGAYSLILENLMERENESRTIVLITAAGLQGEQPLVNGIM